MKLKTKYILYISVIHLIFLAITIVIFKHNKALFVICEAALIVSLILFISLFRAIFRPFKLLSSGVESISDKDFSMKILPVGQPELDNLINVFNKMIEQLRLERTIASEKNFFLEKLIEASPAAIIILDKNQNVRSYNTSAIGLLKLNNDSSSYKTLDDFPAPWNNELFSLKDFTSILVQVNGINQYKCSKSYFIDRGIKQSFFIIEELTKELLHAERQSYEKVIRMMSHEVNNSVGAVNSIVESSVNFMNSLKNDALGDFTSALNIARERMDNLNVFTKRFADIVKIPLPELNNCNLNETIDNILVGFYKDIQEKEIQIKKHYTDSVNIILFDQQQLELVLTNILKNAIQAINSNGIIEIKINLNPTCLIIENNGEIIPPDIQKKLFEPFFTTKKLGQGIGLTLIRDVLMNHNCEFSLKTRNDGITEFRIEFNNKNS